MSPDRQNAIDSLLSGNTSLGIELGSTRIKASLIGNDHVPIASGEYDWENQLVDGIWTYSLTAIWEGVTECYARLKQDTLEKYDVTLTKIGSIGISAMMHGYMVFDIEGKLLVPFRTWRNTITAESSRILTELFDYPIPHRWSISHLYQAILNNERHISQIGYITTLAGYIHRKLTGARVLGVGDASGMFPIDTSTKNFDKVMISRFNDLIRDEGYPWRLEDILPEVLVAGEPAGYLTEEGVKLLDRSGGLNAGIPFCPAEGDAGTGMTATNSVAPRTGNVSAGTSVFLMAVLEHNLKKVHPEIDLVTTPSGDPVAMVHCNNCTGDIDAWVKVFTEFAGAAGVEIDKTKIYDILYAKALEADRDNGGLLSYNYISGESITNVETGRPLFLRQPDSRFTLANFMQANLFSAVATLKIGFDVLRDEEQVSLDMVNGHGGFFKAGNVGQRIMAAALDTPIAVMETAGEGGPWGMALLAAFMRNRELDENLQDYLKKHVFADIKGSSIDPDPYLVNSFQMFMQRYKKYLFIEHMLTDSL